MKDIQQLLDQLEAKKAKGLAIGVQDIHDMIGLKDKMQDTRIELQSEYNENKNELENKRAIRYEILKAEVVSEGEKKKAKYTDEGVKSKIKQEFKGDETKQAIEKSTIEMLISKIDIVQEYTNLFKLVVK